MADEYIAPAATSPLDQLQRDYAIRTIYGEDPNLSAEAVANVIRNRAEAGRYGGNDVQSVVLAKNQFEPWNNAKARARMEALAPDSPEYQRLGALVDRVWSGGAQDITGGATHFYAPKAQAALGRQVPAWAKGEGQQIGPHVFFAPEGAVTRSWAPQAAPPQVQSQPPSPGPIQTAQAQPQAPTGGLLNYGAPQQRGILPQAAPQSSGGILAPPEAQAPKFSTDPVQIPLTKYMQARKAAMRGRG
jgi:hypothetical protein